MNQTNCTETINIKLSERKVSHNLDVQTELL